MLEDDCIEYGNVQDREESDDAGHDGAKEELVAPDVVHPLGEIELRAGLHAEE